MARVTCVTCVTFVTFVTHALQAEEWRATVDQALAERDAQLAEAERCRAAASSAREEFASSRSAMQVSYEASLRYKRCLRYIQSSFVCT